MMRVSAVAAELGRPADGIPHVRREIAIFQYLGMPGLDVGGKMAMPVRMTMARLRELDLRERAGLLDGIDSDIGFVEQAIAESAPFCKLIWGKDFDETSIRTYAVDFPGSRYRGAAR